jgi:hypothetical protein
LIPVTDVNDDVQIQIIAKISRSLIAPIRWHSLTSSIWKLGQSVNIEFAQKRCHNIFAKEFIKKFCFTSLKLIVGAIRPHKNKKLVIVLLISQIRGGGVFFIFYFFDDPKIKPVYALEPCKQV